MKSRRARLRRACSEEVEADSVAEGFEGEVLSKGGRSTGGNDGIL